jgi:hypothetical protein
MEMDYWKRCCGYTRMDRVINDHIWREMEVNVSIYDYSKSMALIEKNVLIKKHL